MSYLDALQHHLQRMVMADFGLTWKDVRCDQDGDVCFLDDHGRVVTVRLRHLDSATWVRVFVHASQELKRSAKLLREVNELNHSLVGARALLTPERRLVLAAEVLAESLEPGELGRLVSVLSENAERSGGMIQLLYGERSADRPGREVEP